MEKQHTWKLFDTIAPSYDRINRVLSFGIDASWRKKMGKFLPQKENISLLDCASGTADQIISLFRHNKNIVHVTGSDLSKEMLSIGEKKVAKEPFGSHVELLVADACQLPFEDDRFDCVTISFGIRNVPSLAKAFQEFYRVLKPGGKLLVLEFSQPKNRLIRTFFLFYLRHILPRIGGILSGNKEAYRYLNTSIEEFPYGQTFCRAMQHEGFSETNAHPLTLGVASIYSGTKRNESSIQL